MKRRIVIKVGKAVITEHHEIAKERMLNLVKLIAELKKTFDVILISSGAVAAGYSALKLDKRKQIGKKALAAAGQPILMSNYKKQFDFYEIDIAQILLTEEDFDSRKKTRMFQEIINAHLDKDIMPIISENDITSTPDQLFNDNDQLSAHVAFAIEAELLVILSDIDGYFDQDPHVHPDARRYERLHRVPAEALEAELPQNAASGSGGIVTKLKAADFLLQRGMSMLLCNGLELSGARAFLLEGSQISGTLFVPE